MLFGKPYAEIHPAGTAAVNFTEYSLMLMFLASRRLVETFHSMKVSVGHKEQ